LPFFCGRHFAESDRQCRPKKHRRKQLGNPKLLAAAAERDVLMEPVLKELAGLSLRAIAAELDRRGIKSWSGKPWSAPSVKAALVRLGLVPS
jgi:hypothetical protein